MNKYKHTEAFCHMTYRAQEFKYVKTEDGVATFDVVEGTEELKIWNSRDGVTPFSIIHPETGTALNHVDWERDVREPDYQPKEGDYIWIDGRRSPHGGREPVLTVVRKDGSRRVVRT